jgi:hypothetical protein
MGWKGLLRSGMAAARASQRDAVRRQKQYEQQRKQNAKLQELEHARLIVDEFENYLEVIQTVHRDCSDNVNWKSVAASPMPQEPQIDESASRKAANELQAFKPNFFQKVLGSEKKQRQKLADKVAQLQRNEQNDHMMKIGEWKREVSSWRDMVAIANGVLAGKTESYKACIEEMNPFEEIKALGSGLGIKFNSPSEITVNMIVHDDKVIPKQQKSLLASGKLSTKDMPVGRRNEIYQDYVCSAVLRVGRELFALLPIEQVIVNANGDLLNSATGRLESQTILSAMLVRQTMERINFNSIDPSDSMKNFKCNMNFKKGQGMSPVTPLS